LIAAIVGGFLMRRSGAAADQAAHTAPAASGTELPAQPGADQVSARAPEESRETPEARGMPDPPAGSVQSLATDPPPAKKSSRAAPRAPIKHGPPATAAPARPAPPSPKLGGKKDYDFGF
jgi:hypothetical protein